MSEMKNNIREKSLVIILMLMCLVSTPLHISASNVNNSVSGVVNDLASGVGETESTFESKPEDAYSGDDEYYLDDGSRKNKNKDYYNENGSPTSAGSSNINKYMESDRKAIIEKMDTLINVSDDNTYFVTKNVKVYYNTEGNHSITMTVPLNNLYPSSDDKVKDVMVKSNLDGTRFETSMSKGQFKILINDSTKGLTYADYVITYTYVSMGDNSEKHDVLMQDLIGFHDSPVYKLNFSILMPSEYEQKELQFTDINGNKLNIVGSIENSKLSGYYDSKLENGSVVIALKIKDGYFDSTGNEGFFQIILKLTSTLCALMVLGGFALAGVSYYRFGISKKVNIIPQRNPIKDLSPVDIILALTGGITNENIMLYIIHLANEGYIAIEDNTNKLQRNRNPAKGYVIKKTRDYDGEDISIKEFMMILFKNGNSVTPYALSNAAYKPLNKLRLKIQDRGVKHLWEIDDARRRLCSNVGIIIPLVSSLLLSLYNLDVGLSIKTLSFLYGPITTIAIYSLIKIVDRAINKRNMVRGGVADIMTWIYVSITALLIIVISGAINSDMFSKHSSIMTLAYLVEMVLIFCSCNMKKRTDKGVELCGRILGLRSFMIEANEITIKKAVLKDEQYVYKSLPYAIALGVAKDSWLSAMDSCYIDDPTWYVNINENEFRLVDFMKDWFIITSSILEEPSSR